MRFSATQIQPIARPHRFDERVVEEVLYFVRLLNTMNSHPSLNGMWVLKGGTQFDFQRTTGVLRVFLQFRTDSFLTSGPG